jgi:hypothetical protein
MPSSTKRRSSKALTGLSASYADGSTYLPRKPKASITATFDETTIDPALETLMWLPMSKTLFAVD